MIKRYKVLKDCLDDDGNTMPVGTEIEYKEGDKNGSNINQIEDGQKWYVVTYRALKNTDFFQEIEEKAKISLELTYPDKDGWNQMLCGSIKEGDQLTFGHELNALFKRYTGKGEVKKSNKERTDEIWNVMKNGLYIHDEIKELLTEIRNTVSKESIPQPRDTNTYLEKEEPKITEPYPITGEYWISKLFKEAVEITGLFHDSSNALHSCSYIRPNGNEGSFSIEFLDRIATYEEVKAYKKEQIDSGYLTQIPEPPKPPKNRVFKQPGLFNLWK